ncbi:hypothetical protein MMC25_005317 [Agyrium rufum]|nr:hypothetical protein [Agyrium rufum]
MASKADESASESGQQAGPEYGDVIDAATFEQILEMDDEDDDDRDFSRSIVYGFFEQAEATFTKMDSALEEKDLPTLSSLGHFLKGSSATLGLTQMKDSCEKIQNYGVQKDDDGDTTISNKETCLTKIRACIKLVRVEYAEAERRLRAFYRD